MQKSQFEFSFCGENDEIRFFSLSRLAVAARMSQTCKSQHAVAGRDHMLNVIAILSIHFTFPSKLTRNTRLSHRRAEPRIGSK